ncbi:MAG: diguanylate cyclase [Gammaproteobacteria bacterium]
MIKRLESATALAILENAPLGVLVLDNKGQVLSINKTLQSLLGIQEDQLSRTSSSLSQNAKKCLFDPQEVMHLPATGSQPECWLKCWRQSLGDGLGDVLFYADITSQQQAQERLTEELALYTLNDPLTSLPNRRALLQSLEPQISRSRRYENPLAVIVLKIANLAQLDAIHGDSSADRAMMAVSQFLKDQMRWVDMIGRMDTDEFLLILPETAEAAAVELTKKLQLRLAELQITGADGRSISLEARCGVAGWIKGDDTNKLLHRAYQSL